MCENERTMESQCRGSNGSCGYGKSGDVFLLRSSGKTKKAIICNGCEGEDGNYLGMKLPKYRCKLVQVKLNGMYCKGGGEGRTT